MTQTFSQVRANAYTDGHTAGFDLAIEIALSAMDTEIEGETGAKQLALQKAVLRICSRARANGWQG